MSKRAAKADSRLEELEKDMLEVARKMGKSATSRENAAKREESLKKKLVQLNKQLMEAESRARHTEEDQNKLEVLVEQMKEEKDVIYKMRDKNHPVQT